MAEGAMKLESAGAIDKLDKSLRSLSVPKPSAGWTTRMKPTPAPRLNE